MIKILYGMLFSLCCLVMANGQPTQLDQYLDQALDNNLSLIQKIKSWEKSEYASQEAKGKYYPDISFNARYSIAEGGRTIDFPVGDLLNPVYASLNSLTGTQDFPQISNQTFYFYRPTEQVTRLQLIQPIFSPEIYFNHRIHRELASVSQADMKVYKRFLVAEVKTAYYNYLKTVEVIELYHLTRSLLEENIRVNESLYENDKVTIDNVYRSRAELSNMEQRLAEAHKYNQSARAYFNFLLNRPLDEEIIMESQDYNVGIPELQVAIDDALEHREELQSLRTYQQVTENIERMNRSNRLPRLFGALDYGFQGTDYQIGPEDDFFLASLVLQWNIFAGLQNNARIQQAQIDYETVAYKISESQQQLSMEVIDAYYDLIASYERIEANQDELTASRNAFKIIQRKFNEGQASLLEFIDARTSMTNAEQNLILTRYDHLIKYSHFERVACIYPVNNE